jgi:hypothetical protein
MFVQFVAKIISKLSASKTPESLEVSKFDHKNPPTKKKKIKREPSKFDHTLSVKLPGMACSASTPPFFNLKLSQSHPTRRTKPSQALTSYTQISTQSCSTCNAHFKAKFPIFSKLPLLSGRRLRFHVSTQYLRFLFFIFLVDSFCVWWAGGSTERVCFWGRG